MNATTPKFAIIENGLIFKPALSQDAIEHIIDSTSLAQLCDMIGEVCDAKGAHLENNWQDRWSARAWKKNAKKFYNLSKEMHNV